MDDKIYFLRNTDREPKFAYNIEKAQLKKGSTISKSIHPILHVENFKNRLLQSGKMVNKGKVSELKRTINTGWNMAKNLHYGTLINNKNPLWRKPEYLSFTNNQSYKETQMGNIMSSCSQLVKSSFMDELRIDEICRVTLDFDKLNQHNGNEFSPVENLFYKELIKRDIISSKARHGKAENNECDIVDEEKGIQIEVITEFKSRLQKSRAPQADFNEIALEYTNDVFVHTSQALLSKLYKKDYTYKYEKYIAIYCYGDLKSIIRMSKVLLENIKQRGKIKNNYKGIYLIWNDFLDFNKTYFFYTDNKGEEKIDELNEGVYILERRESISYPDLEKQNSSNHYVWRATSIFDDTYETAGILPATEIIKIVKILRILTT